MMTRVFVGCVLAAAVVITIGAGEACISTPATQPATSPTSSLGPPMDSPRGRALGRVEEPGEDFSVVLKEAGRGGEVVDEVPLDSRTVTIDDPRFSIEFDVRTKGDNCYLIVARELATDEVVTDHWCCDVTIATATPPAYDCGWNVDWVPGN